MNEILSEKDVKKRIKKAFRKKTSLQQNGVENVVVDFYKTADYSKEFIDWLIKVLLSFVENAIQTPTIRNMLDEKFLLKIIIRPYGKKTWIMKSLKSILLKIESYNFRDRLDIDIDIIDDDNGNQSEFEIYEEFFKFCFDMLSKVKADYKTELNNKYFSLSINPKLNHINISFVLENIEPQLLFKKEYQQEINNILEEHNNVKKIINEWLSKLKLEISRYKFSYYNSFYENEAVVFNELELQASSLDFRIQLYLITDKETFDYFAFSQLLKNQFLKNYKIIPLFFVLEYKNARIVFNIALYKTEFVKVMPILLSLLEQFNKLLAYLFNILPIFLSDNNFLKILNQIPIDFVQGKIFDEKSFSEENLEESKNAIISLLQGMSALLKFLRILYDYMKTECNSQL